MEQDDRRPPPRTHWARVLLLIPVVASLSVPFYNRVEPAIGGVPFFYWFQLALVLVCTLVCVIVYRSEG